MTTRGEKHSSKTPIIIVSIIVAALVGSFASAISIQQKAEKRLSCESSGKVYVDSSNSCREKNTSEKFEEQCYSGITFTDNTHYTCNEISAKGLEQAYLDNAIKKHGDEIYEEGTYEEILAGKKAGDYCLEASDTWLHIGEKRCVVFHYTYMACSNGYCFLNEKKNYNDGFVAFFGKYRMYNWNQFRNKFYNKGPILVCGEIKTYRGHPEIKITSTGQFLLEPKTSWSGNKIVYKYSCN